jgi:hypothetical protein
MPERNESVGRYELVREIGRGGMATVYLARQVDLDRLVALKELGGLRTSDASFARRFLREAQLAGSLSHPNIVTVHDYFDVDGTPYIAMEYLENGSLRPYVGRMTLAQIGGVVEGLLAGLAEAEKHEIVHRDLKPENLLVTADGRIKIADFGIAKATNRLQSGGTLALTSTGVAVGTPHYMAPEQAIASGIGPWTDLYSVGMIAFELLVGRPPFADTDQAMAVLLRQVNEEVPAVTELDPRIDRRISDWIGWMVAKEPAERPPSAVAAWDELEDTLLALAGPRWRRAAPLVGGAASEGHPVSQAAFLDGPTEPVRGRPLASPSPAATVAPSRPAPATAPRGGKRRSLKLARLVVAGVAVAAIAATLISRVGHSQTPTQASAVDRPVPTATTPTSGTNPAAPSAATPVTDSAPQAAPNQTGVALASEATAARKLARHYDTAAAKTERLSTARVAGSPTARLATGLRQTAAAYRRAAGSAAAGDVSGYVAALRDVSVGKQAVNAALAALRSAAGQTSTGNSQAPASQSPSVTGTPCSGDSVSDDPSDDDCGSP